MAHSLKLITTGDGSHSLLREDLNETYHSFHGAEGESQYVFIEQGLEHVLLKGADSLAVFEVGFGTGLNALLAARFAQKRGIQIDFHTTEPFPVPSAIYRQLNYGNSEEEKALLQQLHELSWEKSHEVDPGFLLTKHQITLEDFVPAKQFNVVFFDAFAPSKQAEVWSLDNLQKCHRMLLPGGVLTSYCAQGQFKRNLAAAGFEVQTLKGAMGKKEMVRGVK